MGGGDKACLPLGGRPLLAHCVARLRPQCAALVLSANGDPARFASFGLPVVPDNVPGSAGPLAGILAGLDFVAQRWPEAADAVSLPADTPFIPGDLVTGLANARRAQAATIGMAACEDRRHPAVALWPVAIRHDIRKALLQEDERSVLRFASRYALAVAEWPKVPFDPFFNINTPDDLAEAEAILRDINRPCGYGT